MSGSPGRGGLRRAGVDAWFPGKGWTQAGRSGCLVPREGVDSGGQEWTPGSLGRGGLRRAGKGTRRERKLKKEKKQEKKKEEKKEEKILRPFVLYFSNVPRKPKS
uniref:SH3 domain binding glutamate rich protein n=1 Tax=Myotis myotis TaxID=51298 RepID=A0A7J8A1J2_MYOMY|nr:SH3 domain binding glutamate rich protein [Myotis myotis]